MKLYLCSVNSVARTMGKLVRNYLHTNHLKKKKPYTIHRNNGITKITKNRYRVSDCACLVLHTASHSVSTYHSLSAMMYVCLCSTYLPANIGSKWGSRRGPKATSDKKRLGFTFLATYLPSEVQGGFTTYLPSEWLLKYWMPQDIIYQKVNYQ